MAAKNAPEPEVPEGQMAMPGTDTPAVPAAELRGYAALIGEIMEIMEVQGDTDLAVMDRILQRIMDPESTPDVLDAPQPVKMAEVVGHTLVVHGIDFTESDIEDARIPFYANLHVARAGSKRMETVNCGGEQILAQAIRMWREAEWPRVVKIIQVGKEKAGRTRPYIMVHPQDVGDPGY